MTQVERSGGPEDVLRFGVFEADVRSGELHENGRRMRLQEQPFQVPVMLLERGGPVVTREELREQIWPDDTFVGHRAFRDCIARDPNHAQAYLGLALLLGCDGSS